MFPLKALKIWKTKKDNQFSTPCLNLNGLPSAFLVITNICRFTFTYFSWKISFRYWNNYVEVEMNIYKKLLIHSLSFCLSLSLHFFWKPINFLHRLSHHFLWNRFNVIEKDTTKKLYKKENAKNKNVKHFQLKEKFIKKKLNQI